MPKACNLRYQYLKQLESEFAASMDATRRRQLAQEINALQAEFGIGRQERSASPEESRE